MVARELLFVLATIFWCQALPTRTVIIYACAVSFTALLKYLEVI